MQRIIPENERFSSGFRETEPVRPAWWQSLASRLACLALPGLFVVAVLGFFGLSAGLARLPRPDTEVSSARGPGSGIVIRFEPRDLWIPRSLAELARRPDLVRSVRTHADWRRLLEAEGRTDLWYAITARGYQADGGWRDLTSIRWICEDASHFEEFRSVLTALGGHEPLDGESAFSGAPFHILDEEQSRRDPRAVMAEMIRERGSSQGP